MNNWQNRKEEKLTSEVSLFGWALYMICSLHDRYIYILILDTQKTKIKYKKKRRKPNNKISYLSISYIERQRAVTGSS